MKNWKPTARQLRTAAELARTAPPLDRLPYTPAFDLLHEQLSATVGPLRKDQSWHCFLSARKRGWVGARHKESKP
ncbi:MAG: hypothetical protein CHACPFDD_00352 [Phycisphaerae bacterium]|nr:hypothetical protein [Phycisphaerae bacterium]